MENLQEHANLRDEAGAVKAKAVNLKTTAQQTQRKEIPFDARHAAQRAKSSPLATSQTQSGRFSPRETAKTRAAAAATRTSSPLAVKPPNKRASPRTPARSSPRTAARSSPRTPVSSKPSSLSTSSTTPKSTSSSKGPRGSTSAAVRYYNVSSPVGDYIRGKTKKVSSPVPSPPSLENSPRASPSRFTNVASPVGQYIRGLSPTVQSPSRKPSSKPLQTAFAHSPRVTMGSIPASTLTASPFARASASAGKPLLATMQSPSSSPAPRDDAQRLERTERDGALRLEKQEILLSPQPSPVASPAPTPAPVPALDLAAVPPEPRQSSPRSHQLANEFRPGEDPELEEKRARLAALQKKADHDRMVATQRQHVARVMATYAVARGRANALGMLRTRAKLESKRLAAAEAGKARVDTHEAQAAAIMRDAMQEVAGQFTSDVEEDAVAGPEQAASAETAGSPADHDDLVGLLFVKTPEDGASAGLLAARSLAPGGARSPSCECQLSPDSDGVDELGALLAGLEGTAPGSWAVDSILESAAAGGKIAGAGHAGEDDEEQGLLACRELLMPSSALSPRRIRISGHLRVKPLARTMSSVSVDGKSVSWKKRWVVVHLNFLFVYRTQDSRRPLVVALLDSAEVSAVPDDAKRVRLQTRVGRQLFFEAETPQEAARWRRELGRSGYEHLRAAANGFSDTSREAVSARPASPAAAAVASASSLSWDGELCNFSLCAVL